MALDRSYKVGTKLKHGFESGCGHNDYVDLNHGMNRITNGLFCFS
jgi:hypothetical protein